MRRIIMFNRVSADGYFSTPDGGLDWAAPDDRLDEAMAGRIPDADAILFGRRTYDMFESFWPRASALRTMGLWINEAAKLVFSNTRRQLTWRNSQLLGAFDAREVTALKQRPGKNIMIFGSGSIVSLLTQHGLIDEYDLVVSPILLGKGAPWLTAPAKHTQLELIESKAYASGNVLFRYGRAGERSSG